MSVPRIKCPSLESFNANYLLPLQPVILEGIIDHWPALNKHPWRFVFSESMHFQLNIVSLDGTSLYISVFRWFLLKVHLNHCLKDFNLGHQNKLLLLTLSCSYIQSSKVIRLIYTYHKSWELFLGWEGGKAGVLSHRRTTNT